MRHYIRSYSDLPEANILASLTGYQADLQDVLGYCSRLEAQIHSYSVDHIVWEALATAAAIAYARCFKSGVRSNVLTSVPHDLEPDIREFHERIIALRDKHLAHSVNSFEENVVVTLIEMERTIPVRVDSIEVQSRRMQAIGWNDIPKLRRLAEAVHTLISDQLEREKESFLNLVRALPIDIVASNQQDSLPAFFSDLDITKRRSAP